MVKNIFPLIIVVLLAFVAGLPLIHKDLPPTHDGEYHVVRFYEFDKTLRDGNWYPRFAADLNNGYGVPLFNYVYPLPNYVASFFHLFGFSFIDSFKLNMFLAIILGAVFFYLWAKVFWGVWGGLVGSIFYTFSPYHFVDIYIRGSVGEIWALAFFPAFLWSITRFIHEFRTFNITSEESKPLLGYLRGGRFTVFFVMSSVFLSLIIFSHNILALMFFFFAVVYMGFLIYQTKNRKYIILNTLYIMLLSLGLSAIFWLPAILEKKYVTGLEVFDASYHFPDLYQLLMPSWGSGFSGENVGSQMSFQIGIANLFAVFLSLLLFFVYKKKNKSGSIVLFFILLFLLIVFLMLKVSLPIWQAVPFMNYFQFPWRLLSLEILIASFLSGSIVYFCRSKIVATCLVLIAFFLGIGYAKPAHYLYRDDSYYISRSNFIDGTNSPGNVFNTVYFDTGIDKEKKKIKFLKGEGKIDQEIVKTTYYKFAIEASKQSEAQVNTAYFPDWSVFVDGRKTKIDITDEGLFSFNLDRGNHEVEVRLVNTTVRNLADLLFFTSIALLVTLFIKALFATIRKS